ncbi:MAG TPA: hypothetical protein QGF58_24505 [Myxococcota bacterium]|nr:hypothetical protein [Myxococcota bacterium]
MKFQIKHDRLVLPTGLSITFQRTLRISDDDKTWPLPPGFGAFPLRRVDDYADTVPQSWREQGGVFLPMYQREAMWMSISCWPPHALKVGIGKVCALTGEQWSEDLHRHPQDYLVSPPQPWLDGICVGDGRVRQFVAMPLGSGTTVEGQVTGEETVGGLQLQVVPPKPGVFASQVYLRARSAAGGGPPFAAPCAPLAVCLSAKSSMGLAAGGSMRQKIYPDPHKANVWDIGRATRCFVHIVDSLQWTRITGEEMPPTPVSVQAYRDAGFPWYELYDEHCKTLEGEKKLKDVKSLGELIGTVRDGLW